MIKSSFKKTEEGGIEVIFAIPSQIILKNKEETLREFADTATIAGFRKGKAPISKVEELTSEEKLTEHILSHILPKAFTESVKVHKFTPAIYPKFEAIKITSSKNVATETVWEIKATTCELPEFAIPKDLKKKLKHDKKDQNILTSEAGQAMLIKSLLETIKIVLPQMLIEEEVNARLSQLLARIEKLGLSLEGYLKSVSKDIAALREEYKSQAIEAISLELILNKIALDEKIEVTEDQVNDFIKSTGEDTSKVDDNKRDILKRVLTRRMALEKLGQQ